MSGRTAASAALNGERPPADAGRIIPRITGPSNLRPGDVVVHLGRERTVTRIVKNLDDTVVHYSEGDPDTFGIGATVLRRRLIR